MIAPPPSKEKKNTINPTNSQTIQAATAFRFNPTSSVPNTISNEISHDHSMSDLIMPDRNLQPHIQAQPIINQETQTRIVSLEHLQNFVSSKRDLYNAMTFKAQLFLPPVQLCTMEFMGQVLTKKKRVLHVFEIAPVMVSSIVKRRLTIEVLLKLLKDNVLITSYLPDDPQSHVTREYLFTIVNTLDASFFSSVQ